MNIRDAFAAFSLTVVKDEVTYDPTEKTTQPYVYTVIDENRATIRNDDGRFHVSAETD
jgi:hypothetical protein